MGQLPLPHYAAELTREAFREREQKWCRFVLDVLMDRLTANGTLLVPSFTYSCSKPGSIFNAEKTPSENGPFTEFFRTRTQTIRSLHPVFSLAGMGGDAPAILRNIGRSAFGAMSPFARFSDHGVRFLCLGVELRTCITYIHHLEQTYGCPHRYSKSFGAEVIADGKQVLGEWYAYVSYRGLNYSSDIASLQHALKARGKLIEAEWEGRHNQLAEIADVDAAGYELLTKNSCAFVDRQMALTFEEPAFTGGGNESPDVATLTITATDVGKAGGS